MSLGHHAAHHMGLSRDRPGSGDSGGEPESPVNAGQRCMMVLAELGIPGDWTTHRVALRP